MDRHGDPAPGATAPAPLRFPDGFRWGIGTAGHQNEGGSRDSWSEWEAVPGRIRDGARAGDACGWWRDATPDLDLAGSLGVNALRLTVEWSRVEPEPGRFDPAALDRYRQLVGQLRDRGIEPTVTLHHFAEPTWFAARGGFLAPGAVDRFAAFAAQVTTSLGDLVTDWVTINEPNVFAAMGWLLGEFPPGRRGDLPSTARVLGTLVRAHAAAYRVLHDRVPGARVGWAQHHMGFAPARPGHPLDRLVAAAQDRTFNWSFTEAVRTGRAPAGLRRLAGDLASARGTADFLGVNLYGRRRIAFSVRHWRDALARTLPPGDLPPGAPEPPYGEADPEGLGPVIARLAGQGLPIVVLEHGVADAAGTPETARPAAIARALATVHREIERGADVRGYHHWTLVDNFEWAYGWGMRFGLVALDPATGTRTPRPSADLYRAVASANALTPEAVARHAPGAYAEVFETAAPA